MKVRGNRIETAPKLMIIPMIDVIFFLLVFFMFSSLQMVQQKSLPMQLPQSAAAQSAPLKPLAVTLRADGQISVEADVVALPELSGAVRPFLVKEQERPVILRADQEAEHGKVVAVMDALKSAGVHKLSIAAKGKGA